MLVETLPKTINTLIELLQNATNQNDKITSGLVKGFVETSQITEKDLFEFADFDHPVEDGYGRKMIFNCDRFEIMAMSWNPGDYSSIHNHGYTQWGVVQVFGNAHHFIYQNKGGVLQFAKKEILVKGAITKVVNATVHQMGNPSTGKYMTLHIYGVDEKLGTITADAENYELEFDRVNHTTGGAFFNLPENQIYNFEPCPTPTKEVFINHAKLLIDYYERQKQTPRIKELKIALLGKLRETIC